MRKYHFFCLGLFLMVPAFAMAGSKGTVPDGLCPCVECKTIRKAQRRAQTNAVHLKFQQNHSISIGSAPELSPDEKLRNEYNEALKYFDKKSFSANKAIGMLKMVRIAEKGYVDAMYYVAKCYENGAGGIIDPWQALKWYRLAASKGDWRSKRELSKYYLK